MFVSKRVTIPANTTEANATKTTIKVASDVLHYVAVQFPAGCAGLVHVRVWANEHPVFPSDPALDIAADTWTVESPVIHKFDPGEAYINIQAWNEDDTYEHTITVYASIIEGKYLFPQENVVLQVAEFLRLFRRR
jgi:hypothetical protein